MIDYTHTTVTSDEIIKGLQDNNVNLSDEDKQLIIEKTYKAITDAYNYESNGCDCGQIACPICE